MPTAQDPERRARRMCGLYASGATLEEVGERFGLSRERVRQIFAEAGLPIRSIEQTRALQRARMVAEKSAEICEAFARTKDLDEVARRLKVQKSVVKEVVANRFSAAERRRPRVPAPKTYSEKELIAFVREASAQARNPLSAGAYDDYAAARCTPDGRPWPTSQTIAKRLGGTWRAGARAAGIAVRSSGPQGVPRTFDEERCADALRIAARELGKVPTAREYDDFARASSDALPSQATVRNRLGTWYAALARAGL